MMSVADWLVVSVAFHYVAIGILYWLQGQPLLLGLYFCYAAANGFLIALAIAVMKLAR